MFDGSEVQFSEFKNLDKLNEVKQDDWHKIRKGSSGTWQLDRKALITIAFACRDVIRYSPSATKDEIKEGLESAMEEGFPGVSRILKRMEENYEQIRTVVRNMKVKYRTESDHKQFDLFLKEAEEYWKFVNR